MSKKRQDSWTSDEDIILAETVLRYIRNGKTQLEAFKEAGERLSRTAAACGFRWNSTLRKQHLEGIKVARKSKKQQPKVSEDVSLHKEKDLASIEKAISLLEEMKEESIERPDEQVLQDEINRLKEENAHLKAKLKLFNEAWQEIHNIWSWMQNKNEHYN